MSQHFQRFLNRVSMGLMTVAIMSWPAIAFAQTAAPQPVLKKAPPIWLGYLVMFLLLAVVMAISLMPSKRGHQD